MKPVEVLQKASEDRITLLAELIGMDGWALVPVPIQERLHEWVREPIRDMDRLADNLREQIRTLEAVRR